MHRVIGKEIVKQENSQHCWRIVLDEKGGYWIISPGDTFGGYATNELDAKRIFDEKTGAIKEKLPAVPPNNIKVYKGNWERGTRIDRFFLQKKEIGQVVVRDLAPKIVTRVGAKVKSGYDLYWMLSENGLRLAKIS